MPNSAVAGAVPYSETDDGWFAVIVVNPTDPGVDVEPRSEIDVFGCVNGDVTSFLSINFAGFLRNDEVELGPVGSCPGDPERRAFYDFADLPHVSSGMTDSSGRKEVCVSTLLGGVSLGCSEVRVASTSARPVGKVERVRLHPDGMQVKGWALDPNGIVWRNDDYEERWPAVRVAYSNGTPLRDLWTDKSRADVGKSWPGHWDLHGFDAIVPAGPITVTAFDGAPGQRIPGMNRVLGSYDVPASRNPIGKLETIVDSKGRLRVKGWAFDPDTTSPVGLRVRVNNSVVGTIPTTRANRADLPGLYGNYRPVAGFEWGNTTRVTSGQTVCVEALNVGKGANTTMCQTVK